MSKLALFRSSGDYGGEQIRFGLGDPGFLSGLGSILGKVGRFVGIGPQPMQQLPLTPRGAFGSIISAPARAAQILIAKHPAIAAIAATVLGGAGGGAAVRAAQAIIGRGHPGGAAAAIRAAGGGGGRRRGRGITARELRGFRKVTNLLHKVGMQPKGLGRHRRGRIC